MPNSSDVPGSPQSSTLTVKGSAVVPVDLITDATPENSACLLPDVKGHELPGLLMDSELNEMAFMRTSAPWSS